ncbi:hypothetical protein E2C01_056877 [Portunus trituberculatus]|uniref:Uncharacterized protein n=1 Tax=Portunus trituberculatus TaxID=210409 RepID=A0A5B7H0B9_PORTR|nr:hypothetical protein [Portunus trituberculatus]
MLENTNHFLCLLQYCKFLHPFHHHHHLHDPASTSTSTSTRKAARHFTSTNTIFNPSNCQQPHGKRPLSLSLATTSTNTHYYYSRSTTQQCLPPPSTTHHFSLSTTDTTIQYPHALSTTHSLPSTSLHYKNLSASLSMF